MTPSPLVRANEIQHAALSTYSAFHELDVHLGSPATTILTRARNLTEGALTLRNRASDYLAVIRETKAEFQNPDVIRRTLLAYLDGANATADDLARVRSDIDQGVTVLTKLEEEAAAHIVAAALALWPTEEPELWTAPLDIDPKLLAPAAADALRDANETHELLLLTLRGVRALDLSVEERAKRRETFISASSPRIARARWKFIPAVCREFRADLHAAIRALLQPEPTSGPLNPSNV